MRPATWSLSAYRKQLDPEVMTAALDWFSARVGSDELDNLLLAFVEHFPGQSVMRGEDEPHEWLAGSTEGMPHRAAAHGRADHALDRQSQRGIQSV